MCSLTHHRGISEDIPVSVLQSGSGNGFRWDCFLLNGVCCLMSCRIMTDKTSMGEHHRVPSPRRTTCNKTNHSPNTLALRFCAAFTVFEEASRDRRLEVKYIQFASLNIHTYYQFRVQTFSLSKWGTHRMVFPVLLKASLRISAIKAIILAS